MLDEIQESHVRVLYFDPVLLNGRAVHSAVGKEWRMHVNCLDCLDYWLWPR